MARRYYYWPAQRQNRPHMRNGILDVERVLIDEDQPSSGALRGEDYPLTYDADGCPDLPA